MSHGRNQNAAALAELRASDVRITEVEQGMDELKALAKIPAEKVSGCGL